MPKNYKRAQAVISLKNARYNFLEVKSKLKPSTKICCVVKADAYGHGAVELSKLYQSLGAHFFATATFEEAVTLRNNGITKPILILGYTPPFYAKQLEILNLSQTVYSKEYGIALLKACKRQSAKIKIHLKIDTGLNRIGFVCQNKQTSNLNDAVKVLKNDNFILEGIFTHFACSDDYKKGKSYTCKQQSNFLFAIKYLKSKGLNFQIKHAGNSAVVYNYLKFCLDMVRVGIVLYGISPSKLLKEKPK
ncbi:MAG: alanine racemase, partial [Clostridia bacterium]|nr:alanine racemase [Clostridia bacterium]